MDVKEYSGKLVALASEATKAGLDGPDMFFALVFGAIVVLETTCKMADKQFFLDMAESVYDRRANAVMPPGVVLS